MCDYHEIIQGCYDELSQEYKDEYQDIVDNPENYLITSVETAKKMRKTRRLYEELLEKYGRIVLNGCYISPSFTIKYGDILTFKHEENPAVIVLSGEFFIDMRDLIATNKTNIKLLKALSKIKRDYGSLLNEKIPNFKKEKIKKKTIIKKEYIKITATELKTLKDYETLKNIYYNTPYNKSKHKIKKALLTCKEIRNKIAHPLAREDQDKEQLINYYYSLHESEKMARNNIYENLKDSPTKPPTRGTKKI